MQDKISMHKFYCLEIVSEFSFFRRKFWAQKTDMSDDLTKIRFYADNYFNQ